MNLSLIDRYNLWCWWVLKKQWVCAVVQWFKSGVFFLNLELSMPGPDLIKLMLFLHIALRTFMQGLIE